jgi:hypothetical protein
VNNAEAVTLCNGVNENCVPANCTGNLKYNHIINQFNSIQMHLFRIKKKWVNINYQEYERFCGEAWKAEALNLLAFEEEEGDRRENRVLAGDEATRKDFLAQFDAISCSHCSVRMVRRKERVTEERSKVLPCGPDLSTHNWNGPCNILDSNFTIILKITFLTWVFS